MVKELAFISYLNDDNQVISGYYEIIEFDSHLVKFKSNNVIITIPTARILKVKEKFVEDDNGK